MTKQQTNPNAKYLQNDIVNETQKYKIVLEREEIFLGKE